MRHEGGIDYDLIIDRISHEVPFYRAFLKRATLEGTIVINNPFWWSADDKFFNFSLATKLGVAIPKTVLLPQKDYIEGITSESLRNLEFPLDWQGIIDYVGFPAYHQALRRRRLEERLEDQQPRRTLGGLRHDGHALHDLAGGHRVRSVRALLLHRAGGRDDYALRPAQAISVGRAVHPQPDLPLGRTGGARRAGRADALNRALGYDINTVEFAIKDGIPYAIDFMNPAPDAELASVGEFYHNWVTKAVTDLVFRRLEEPRAEPRYRWDALLSGQSATPTATQTLAAAASAAQSAAESMLPQSVRELPSEVVNTVSEFLDQATGVVSGIVEAVTEAAAPGAATEPQSDAENAAAKRSRTAASSSKKGAAKATTKRAPSTKSKKSSTDEPSDS